VKPRVYLDWNDAWVGIFRGPKHWYFCPLPFLVVRWERGQKA
jgi:hypothetical protein